MRRSIVACGLLFLFGAAATAYAEPGPTTPPRASSRKVLRQKEVKVEGSVEKEKARPITPPGVALPEVTEHPESQLHKILDALDEAPFSALSGSSPTARR